ELREITALPGLGRHALSIETDLVLERLVTAPGGQYEEEDRRDVDLFRANEPLFVLLVKARNLGIARIALGHYDPRREVRREEHLLLRPLHEHRDVRALVDAGGPSFHQNRFPVGFRLQELLQLLRIRQQLL